MFKNINLFYFFMCFRLRDRYGVIDLDLDGRPTQFFWRHARRALSSKVASNTAIVLRDMPTEVYCTRANTLPAKEVWMVSDVYDKMKRMKID